MECLKAKEIGAARKSQTQKIFIESDDFVNENKKQIQSAIDQLFLILPNFETKLKEFQELLNTNIDGLKKKLRRANFKQFQQEIELLKAKSEEIDRVLWRGSFKCGLFVIDCQEAKLQLNKCVKEIKTIIYDYLIQRINQENQKIYSKIKEIQRKLKQVPINLEQLDEQRTFIKVTLVAELQQIRQNITGVMNNMNLLDMMKHKIKYEEFERSWKCFGLPLKVEDRKRNKFRQLIELERKFSDDLMEQQTKLALEIASITSELDILQQQEQIADYEQITGKFSELGERLQSAIKEGEIINNRERILHLRPTDYQELNKLFQLFDPYNKVWSLKTWYEQQIPVNMNGPLTNIEAEELTQFVVEAWQDLFRLEKGLFKSISHMNELTTHTRKLYENFKPYLPVISDLRNTCLKKRHWNTLSEICAVNFENEVAISFKELLNLGVMEVKDKIRDVTEIATKEQSFEKMLNKMKAEWKNINFELVEYKDSKCPVLKYLDPINDKLDEDITKIMSILSSPFIKFLENDVQSQRQLLLKTQDIIETWCHLQRSWEYLYPLFISPDIIRQLPSESMKFQQVDKMWRQHMKSVSQSPNVIENCIQQRIKELFQQNIEILDQVVKSLNDYLDSKREVFARFYFLANDELLQIISQTREPNAVQPHLPKLFEGIYNIKFNEMQQIVAMKSIDNEEIQLNEPVLTMLEEENQQQQQEDSEQSSEEGEYQEENEFYQRIKEEGEKNLINVEEWLSNLQETMQATVESSIKNCLQTWQSMKEARDEQQIEWMQQWPGQSVIVAHQLQWTFLVEEQLGQQGCSLDGIKEWTEKSLMRLVTTLRKQQFVSRTCALFSTLIILLVAYKDNLQGGMDSVSCFNWLCVLRYYLQNSIELRMLTTKVSYSNEYLGRPNKLIITPLTTRCYHTLFSALNLHLGGAPEGPAGTGKTETVKDMSRSVGKVCLVFNCSEGIEIASMERFFRGVCLVGAWTCFDEFNRMEVGVLSVVGEQIRSIQTVLKKVEERARRTKGRVKIGQFEEFVFEGRSCQLDLSCGIFVTMNPGYAGRTELPENLKSLFRSMAMMVPNYQLIAEISLFASGYGNARELAVKITQALKLASEQLSTQKHYDFGMRAVKSILIAADNALKKSGRMTQQNEEMLVYQVIIDSNIPKFTQKDLPLFFAIMSDLFPSIEDLNRDYGQLQLMVSEISESSFLTMTESKMRKIVQLHETIEVRHGVMVVGPTFTGKTAMIKTLANAIEQINFRIADEQRQREIKIKREMQLIEQQRLEESRQQALRLKEQQQQQQAQIDQKKKRQKEEVSNYYKLCLLGGGRGRRGGGGEGSSSNYVITGGKGLAIIEFKGRDGAARNFDSLVIFEQKYEKVVIYEVNPKAVTLSQLFGHNDPISNEWFDGVAGKLFRDITDPELIHLSWLLFNGPIDSLWIENLNTVLDDNKKLCLSNGETIRINDRQRVIFEVDSVQEASPATVSRCGMILLERGHIHWQEIVDQWMHSLEWVFEGHRKELFHFLIAEASQKIISPVLDLCYKGDIEIEEISEERIVDGVLRIIESLWLGHKTRSQIRIAQEIEAEKLQSRIANQQKVMGRAEIEQLKLKIRGKDEWSFKEKLELMTAFELGVVWGVGTYVADSQKRLFNNYFKAIINQCLSSANSLFKETQQSSEIPSELQIYDAYFHLEKKSWEPWQTESPPIPPDTKFHEVFVPTAHSIRYTSLAKSLLMHDFAVLLSGRTGTGKTKMAKRLLLDELDQSKYMPTMTAFSANTTSTQTYDILESKIEKQKRKKGVYGPLIGIKNVIFIDDLNMPTADLYGSQPPLELVRQWFAQSGWYDNRTLEFKQIVDIQFLCAMGTGRGRIIDRVVRNFIVLNVSEMEEGTITYISKRILDWGFAQYPDKVKFQIRGLVSLNHTLFSLVAKEFLPLPKKSHYLFNFRDLLKIFQGLISVPCGQYESTKDCRSQLLRLWVYENLCVFSDRLVGYEDKSKFKRMLNASLVQDFRVTLDDALSGSPPELLKFGNFMDPHAVDKHYAEIEGSSLSALLDSYISEYNELFSRRPISIVLFDQAVDLLVKLNRIISRPLGNSVVVGMGGSGRRTMTRLAAFMQDLQLFEIDQSHEFQEADWYEFLRNMLSKIVLSNKPAVFLITQEDLPNEKAFEDINNLLNLGEIPNLFDSDEKETLILELREIVAKTKQATSSYLALWEIFINRCKDCLHTVLCLSPIGDKFRQRIRNFPSLISCTSPIWLMPWSEESLHSVAKYYLDPKFNQEMTLQSETIDKIAKICVKFQTSVKSITEVYLREQGKYYYVTPISYKQLLQNFSKLYQKFVLDLNASRDKYLNGVEKLNNCNEKVEQLEEELKQLKPTLINKSKETEEVLKQVFCFENGFVISLQVQSEQIEAKKQKDIVLEEEAFTQKKAEISESIQGQCQEKLAQAEPELEQALQALKTLKFQDFVEMKQYKNPPVQIRMVMDAICIMLDRKPKKVFEQFKYKEDYWDEAKKVLSDPQKLLKSLETYKKNEISEKVIEKMKKFLEQNPTFQPEIITKASKAGEGLCKWCLAIYKYHFVYKMIHPLREELKLAIQALNEAEEELNKKRKLLEDVEDKCKQLNQKYEDANLEKQQLKISIQDCETKLKRAIKLMQALGGEQTMWQKNVEDLTEQISNVLGDALLSVGSVSYLGPFLYQYREQIIQSYWIPKIIEENIVCSNPFSLQKKLGSLIQISDWVLDGLPSDNLSIDNIIIMKHSSLCPLLIDPQKQATKFLLKQESQSKNLIICKPNKELSRELVMSIRTGKTLFIQGIGETVDNLLDPILTKSVETRGGKQIIVIAGTIVEYNPNFKLYLSTSLSSPHYPPETFNKVNVLDFSITSEGLKEQLLSIIGREEEPKDEDEKMRIMFDNFDFLQKKTRIEEEILDLLQQTDEDKILDDEKLLISLTESKQMQSDIYTKLETAKLTEQRINNNRQNYERIARLGSGFFFILKQLQKVSPMYAFSLEFFTGLYIKAIRTAEKPEKKNLKLRIPSIFNQLIKVFYQQVSISVFNKHEILLEFLMAVAKIQIECESYDSNELQFLLTGVSNKPIHTLLVQSPDHQTFPIEKWTKILHLSNLQNFDSLQLIIKNDTRRWNSFIRTISEELMESEAPAPFHQNLSTLSNLILRMTLRPDLVLQLIRHFVQMELWENNRKSGFASSLADVFPASSNSTPVLYLLSGGSSPNEEITALAVQKVKCISSIAIGKGQENKVMQSIQENAKIGQWLLLENCHLAVGYLSIIEEVLEEFEKTKPKAGSQQQQLLQKQQEFRLFMTSYAADGFPKGLLEKSLKIAKENVRGIRNNIAEIYLMQNSSKTEIQLFDSCSKQPEWQKLYLSLSFFHAIVTERKRFGPIGWNIQYQFDQTDFLISRNQLLHFLDNYETVQYDALLYLTGECFYGGRVTDQWDRRLVNSLLKAFYNSKALETDNYQFSSVKEFVIPNEMNLESAIQFISQLPEQDNPEIFGLHPNASITSEKYEQTLLMQSLLEINPKASDQPQSSDQYSLVINQISEIMHSHPQQFNIDQVLKKYPNSYYDSMNTVLIQELLRYNLLIETIATSLQELNAALEGTIIMNSELEQLSEQLALNKIPTLWLKRSYPSMKSLANYYSDFQKRISVLQQWIDEGQPAKFWIPGFFFIQSFFTGILQNYARKMKIPIDNLDFDYQVLSITQEIIQQPENGSYGFGLYLEGAQWDITAKVLTEQEPSVLYDQLPHFLILPTLKSKIQYNPENNYLCPLYKTSERKGTLSTTGHSTNFIAAIKLPSKLHEDHWIKRGVALLTQLDY